MNKRKQRKSTNNHQKWTLIGSLSESLFMWYLESFYPTRKAVYAQRFADWVRSVNKLSKDRGKRWTLSYCKLNRLSVTKFLSGEPLSSDAPGIKLNKDGLPVFLHAFNPLIRNRKIEDLKIIFTMLNLTRGVILEPVYDFKSITDTWEGNLPTKWYTFRTAVKYSLNLRRLKYHYGGLHTSTKSGPIGQAMLYAIKDYQYLEPDLKLSLQKIGGPELTSIFDCLNQQWDGIPLYQHSERIINPPVGDKPTVGRKMSLFGDKEGKTRVIGILDYWSQSVLRSIHKDLEGFLRKIPEDCTFDQTAWYAKLPKDRTYYSFDLSNATDRLPIKHQEDILALVYGKKVASVWASILVDYAFLQRKTKQSIKYSVGQPMGAYSSWPIMALQHHAIVHYAAILVGESPKGQYVVLGDDIVICNDKIAEMYKTVIAELGVQISKQKTHVSKDICEFAKRWFYRGTEITAFPLHSIKNNLKRYYLLQNSLSDARGKGYMLSEELERASVIKLIGLTGKKHQAPRLYKLYKLFDAIVDKTASSEDHAGNIMKIVLANWNIPEDNKEKYFSSVETFRSTIDTNLEEYFLDITSEGNQEMMEMMDQMKVWKKGISNKDLFDQLSKSIPIIFAFESAWKRRSEILERYYKEFANDKDKLRASLVLLESLPTVSTQIVNTRNSHKIAAAHSRLVKMLLDLLVKPAPVMESDEDWFSSFKTIDSSEAKGSD